MYVFYSSFVCARICVQHFFFAFAYVQPRTKKLFRQVYYAKISSMLRGLPKHLRHESLHAVFLFMMPTYVSACVKWVL